MPSVLPKWAGQGSVQRGGGGLGPKSLCTKNGLTRFSQRQISFFPRWPLWSEREGGSRWGAPPPPPPTAILILPWGRCIRVPCCCTLPPKHRMAVVKIISSAWQYEGRRFRALSFCGTRPPSAERGHEGAHDSVTTPFLLQRLCAQWTRSSTAARGSAGRQPRQRWCTGRDRAAASQRTERG